MRVRGLGWTLWIGLILSCGARSGLRWDGEGDVAPTGGSSMDVDDTMDVDDDEGPLGLLDCPTSPSDPRLTPLLRGRETAIDGASFLRRPARELLAYAWTIQDDYCDAWVQTPSYVAPELDSQVLSLTAGRPGPHRVTLQVSDGSRTESCDLRWTVPGRGLRIELCWDTSTTVDLDLYLHTPHNQNPFFAAPSPDVVETLTADTCNPGNCPAEVRFLPERVDFGYADSPLEFCAEGPSADDFLALRRCPNPRAGADNNQNPVSGTSEVIQVDNPEPGGTLRVMVHNFDNLPAEPRVFIFNQDELLAEFIPPEYPSQFVADQRGTYGVVWRPADVVIQPEGGIVVDALRGPDGAPSYVTIDSAAY